MEQTPLDAVWATWILPRGNCAWPARLPSVMKWLPSGTDQRALCVVYFDLGKVLTPSAFFMLRINCKGYRYKDTHLCGKRSRWTHWVSKGPLGCWKLLTAWATAVGGCWLSPSVLARVRLHLQNRPVWASTVWEAAQRLKWAQWSTQVVSSCMWCIPIW